MAGFPIDYAKLAEQIRKGLNVDARTPPILSPEQSAAMSRMNDQMQRAGVPAEDQPERSWMDTAKSVGQGVLNAAKGVGEMAHRVVAGPQGVDEEILAALAGPLGPLIKDTVLSHIQVGKKAKEEISKGDYAAGVPRAVLAAVPLVGPIASGVADKMSETDEYGRPRPGAMAEGAGELAANVLAPEAAKKIATAVPGGLRPANPVTRAAMEFKEANGIPSSLATASGSPYIGYAQTVADLTPIGAAVSRNARLAEIEGFKRVGGELAERVDPGAPATPESAGLSIQGELAGRENQFGQSAGGEYGRWRQVMESPAAERMVPIDGKMTPMQAPVDVSAMKGRIAPIVDELKLMPAAERAGMAGYTAMKEIMSGPDYVPATTAEVALGEFKRMAREQGGRSQGLAMQLVKEFQPLVDTAVRDVDPAALNALQMGRDLTARQMEVKGVSNGVRDEPVQAYGQMIYAKDAGIERLKSVINEAPAAAPKIARAWLEDALSKAEYEGGFDKLDGLHAKWRDMGPETKRILFRDPKLIRDIGDFFQAAKDSAKDMNPSGSGKLMAVGSQLTYIFTDPTTGVPLAIGAGALSKLMHSPAVVKALTQGMKVNPREVGAATSAAMKIRSLVGENAVPLDKVATQQPTSKEARR